MLCNAIQCPTQQNLTHSLVKLDMHWSSMHAKAQCTPLIPLGEQCCALNSAMLVVLLAHMFFKVVKLCEVLGFCASYFHLCMICSYSLLFLCVVLLLFVIFFMCVSFKSQDWWSSTHVTSFFRWIIMCPWPSSIGVFYLLMCF